MLFKSACSSKHNFCSASIVHCSSNFAIPRLSFKPCCSNACRASNLCSSASCSILCHSRSCLLASLVFSRICHFSTDLALAADLADIFVADELKLAWLTVSRLFSLLALDKLLCICSLSVALLDK